MNLEFRKGLEKTFRTVQASRRHTHPLSPSSGGGADANRTCPAAHIQDNCIIAELQVLPHDSQQKSRQGGREKGGKGISVLSMALSASTTTQRAEVNLGLGPRWHGGSIWTQHPSATPARLIFN